MSTFFGKNLKYLISERGNTNKSVAEKLGFSNSSISNWTKGKSHPAVEDLMRVCDFFEVTETDILRKDLSQPYQLEEAQEKYKPVKRESEAESVGKMYGLLERYTAMLEDAIRQHCPELKDKLYL